MAEREKEEDGGGESLLEWIAAAIGFLLVAAGVWILVGPDAESRSPPDIRVEARAPETAAGGWRMPIRISNTGGQAAEQVRVVAELESNGRRERREATATLVGPRSSEEVAVIFPSDPGAGRVAVWAESYGKP